MLAWSELEEVLLEFEVNIVNILEYSVLTPNSMILGRDIKLPNDSPKEEKVSDNWKKRQRYKHKCKEETWKRWLHEHLAALRERHNLSHKEKSVKISINDLVMIKGDEKNRRKWKIEIIENIFMGKDNTIRSIRIRTGKNVIETPIQLPHPMQLHCDSKTTTSDNQRGKTLNANPEEFRPKRSVAAVVEQRIKYIRTFEIRTSLMVDVLYCFFNNTFNSLSKF